MHPGHARWEWVYSRNAKIVVELFTVSSLKAFNCRFAKIASPAKGHADEEKLMNIFRNPFTVALCAPAYQLVATIAITNDFLMAAIFIMFTLALIGAYVSDFPLLGTLYMNEVAHKVSISSLMGMLLGLMLFLAFGTGGNEGSDGGMVSAGGKFMVTWGIMSLPAYPLMVFLIFNMNKRDLEAEDAIRREKKKKKGGGGGPPIMERDGF